MPKLYADAIKDRLTEALAHAFMTGPVRDQFPEIERVAFSMSDRALGDETHVVTIELDEGRVFSLLVKLGDYIQTKNEPSVGRQD